MTLFAVAATTFLSCSKDSTDTSRTIPQGKSAIRFVASNENAADEMRKQSQSRTEFGDSYTIRWLTTDLIGVYIDSTIATENAEASPERDASGVTFLAMVNAYEPTDLLRAYYPYRAANASNPAAVELTIPAEQSQAAVKQFNGETNPLVAVPAALATGDQDMLMEPIRFRQLGAMAEYDVFTANPAYEGEKIRSVRFAAKGDKPLAGSFIYDLTTVPATGVPAAIDLTTVVGGSTSATVSLPGESTASVTGSQGVNLLYMTLIPGSYAGDLTVTTDKATYTYSDRTVTFDRAYVKRFLLDLARADMREETNTPTSGVIVWQDDFSKVKGAIGTALSTLTGSVEGFTGAYTIKNMYPNGSATASGESLKFSTSSNAGSLTTPALSSIEGTQDLLVTFKADTWKNSKNDFAELVVTAQHAGTVSLSPVVIESTVENNTGPVTMTGTSYFVTVSGATAQTVLVFSGSGTEKRLFFDDLKIETYIPVPTVLINGDREHALTSDDLTEHTFYYRMLDTAEDAAIEQDEASKAWLGVTKGVQDATGGKTPVVFRATQANDGTADRTATLRFTVTGGEPVVVTVTQKKPATRLTMSALAIDDAQTSAASLTVTWTAVPGAADYRYKVMQGTTEIVPETALDDPTATSVSIPRLAAETTYTISVMAVGDGIGTLDSEYRSVEGTTAAKGVATEQVIYTCGFESGEGFKSGTSYQSTVTSGNSGSQWKTFYGTPSTSNKITGSQSMAMRLYSSNNFGYTQTLFDLANATKVTYKAKVGNTNLKLDTSYSVDHGNTWIPVESAKALTTTASDYEFTISPTGEFESVRIRFSVSSASKKPSSGNYQLTIDDVTVYGMVY